MDLSPALCLGLYRQWWSYGIDGMVLVNADIYPVDPLNTQMADIVLRLWGLPTTYVIDRAGRLIGYLTGAAKWDSSQAKKFLDYFLRRTAP